MDVLAGTCLVMTFADVRSETAGGTIGQRVVEFCRRCRWVGRRRGWHGDRTTQKCHRLHLSIE